MDIHKQDYCILKQISCSAFNESNEEAPCSLDAKITRQNISSYPTSSQIES